VKVRVSLNMPPSHGELGGPKIMPSHWRMFVSAGTARMSVGGSVWSLWKSWRRRFCALVVCCWFAVVVVCCCCCGCCCLFDFLMLFVLW